jgi:hypothetical protein
MQKGIAFLLYAESVERLRSRG